MQASVESGSTCSGNNLLTLRSQVSTFGHYSCLNILFRFEKNSELTTFVFISDNNAIFESENGFSSRISKILK